jgi:ABC-2 type transport system permease protein
MKTSLIFRHELIKTLRSRSFLLGLILVPLLSLIVLIMLSSIQARSQADPSQGSAPGAAGQPETLGFVDHSGLIQTIPEGMVSIVKAYPDFAAAEAGLEHGEISLFFSIPGDYLQTGQIEVYRPDFNPIGGLESSAVMSSLLNANLLSDDPALYKRIMQPYNLTFRYLSETSQPENDSGWAFLVPYIVGFLFYILILSSSSMLLTSVAKEKENRVVEIVLTSVKPVQLLTGKIVALGLLGLFQTILWTGTGWFMLRYSGRMAMVPPSIHLPAEVLVWGAIYFALGYAIYASLMAGIGALVNNLRESSQATLLVILPMIVPLMLVSALIEKPNSALSIGLSLFPLTSPVAMMTRLAAVQIPIWQPVLAAVLQALTAWLIVRSVAGMFRAQHLLTGREFSLRLYFRTIFGRA